MATVEDARTALPVVSSPGVVISGVTWDEYLKLLEWVGDRHLKVTYDGFSVELMSASLKHDSGEWELGRMVEQVCFTLGIRFKPAGSTTLKSEVAEKGLEPDLSYWIQNAEAVRGITEMNLALVPPPDLAIEVEVSRTVLDRLAIYSALGVPEVWRLGKRRVVVLLLGEDGQYRPSETSRCLPMLPMDSLSEWLVRGQEVEEFDLIPQFVAWVRETILPRWRAAAEEERGA